MDISSLGPSGLDPFSSSVPVQSDQVKESSPEVAPEASPLPEGTGDKIDTTA